MIWNKACLYKMKLEFCNIQQAWPGHCPDEQSTGEAFRDKIGTDDGKWARHGWTESNSEKKEKGALWIM